MRYLAVSISLLSVAISIASMVLADRAAENYRKATAYSSYTAPHSHFHNGKLPKAQFSHCYTPDDVRANTVTASVPCVTIDN